MSRYAPAASLNGGGDGAGVAEHLLDDPQVGVRGQREGGGAVAQVMEPDWGQAEFLAKYSADSVIEVSRHSRTAGGAYALTALPSNM